METGSLFGKILGINGVKVVALTFSSGKDCSSTRPDPKFSLSFPFQIFFLSFTYIQNKNTYSLLLRLFKTVYFQFKNENSTLFMLSWKLYHLGYYKYNT